VEGGLLNAARALDEHLDQLAAGVERSDAEAARRRAFVHAFVRPHGLERPATPLFVDALEALADARVSPSVPPAWAAPLRAALYPLALAARGTAPGTERLWREMRKQEKLRQRAEEKRAHLQRREAERQARERAKVEERSRHTA
jgi:hypothetical protein